MQNGANALHVTFTAELGDETAAWFERISNPGHNCFRRFHPMQRCVGKYRIESRLETKPVTIHHHDVKATPLGRFKLRQAGIDADDGAVMTGDFLGQDPVAATEIQDSFSRPRVQQS
jgi:hypothetical protein